MNDVIGFDNVAYFDSAQEREWFLANVEGIPAVTMTKLPAITRDDIEMWPLVIVFGEPTETPIDLPPTINVPF